MRSGQIQEGLKQHFRKSRGVDVLTKWNDGKLMLIVTAPSTPTFFSWKLHAEELPLWPERQAWNAVCRECHRFDNASVAFLHSDILCIRNSIVLLTYFVVHSTPSGGVHIWAYSVSAVWQQNTKHLFFLLEAVRNFTSCQGLTWSLI